MAWKNFVSDYINGKYFCTSTAKTNYLGSGFAKGTFVYVEEDFLDSKMYGCSSPLL